MLAAYARSRRQPLTHAKSSPQLGSWAARGRAGRVGWSRPPRSSPRPAGRAGELCGDRARRPGRRTDGLRRGPDRSAQALRATKKGGELEDGRGPAKRKETRKRRERREGGQKPAMSDRGWGRGAAGEAGAGLKIEGTNNAHREPR